MVVDLGAVRPVRALDLKLVGSGTDFEILTAKKKPTKMKDFREVVDVTAAGDSITVRMQGQGRTVRGGLADSAAVRRGLVRGWDSRCEGRRLTHWQVLTAVRRVVVV